MHPRLWQGFVQALTLMQTPLGNFALPVYPAKETVLWSCWLAASQTHGCCWLHPNAWMALFPSPSADLQLFQPGPPVCPPKGCEGPSPPRRCV